MRISKFFRLTGLGSLVLMMALAGLPMKVLAQEAAADISFDKQAQDRLSLRLDRDIGSIRAFSGRVQQVELEQNLLVIDGNTYNLSFFIEEGGITTDTRSNKRPVNARDLVIGQHVVFATDGSQGKNEAYPSILGIWYP